MATPPISPGFTTAPAVDSNVVTSVTPPTVPAPSAKPVATIPRTPEERKAAIVAETDRLQQWSMNDDPGSLSNILSDLTSPDKEIRAAAIEAAEQFGSSNAIPALKGVAANTDDLQEKVALLEAVDFLSLPSIDFSRPATPRTPEQIQAAERRKAEREARRRAQIQKRALNRNSPAPPNN